MLYCFQQCILTVVFRVLYLSAKFAGLDMRYVSCHLLVNFFFVYSKHVRNCMEPFLRMFPLGVLDPRIVQTRSIIAREVAFKL